MLKSNFIGERFALKISKGYLMINNRTKERLLSLFFIFFLLYCLIWLNLYIIQIRQGSFFATIGQQQWRMNIVRYPPRAWIYDRTEKQPLAMNKDSLAAFIIPSALRNPESLKKFLHRHFPAAYERLLAKDNGHFLYLKRRLTPVEQMLIEQSGLNDIHILKEPSRAYPVESTGPLVGITDIDNQGLFGIELMYNTQLGGHPTTYTVEKDARSGHCYFTKETKIQGNEGSPITLTIDSDLQFLAYEELKETVHEFQSQEGSVVILDPATGDILVMANYPDFDPNDTKTLAMATTKNKIITEAYELGSVMKAFVALAALEEGVVTPDEIIDCENKKITYLNGWRFSTWKEHGLLPFRAVFTKSNNIGMAKVAQRLGPKLYDHYIRCGFGKKTGLGFPGEQSGFVNPPERWTKPSIISLSFGYEITATLLQLASAFAMIANEGKPITPRLIKQDRNTHPTPPQNSLYSPQAIQSFCELLEGTITNGTAHRAAIPGFIVRGKTGSANLVVDGTYSPDHSIFTFAGIIEKNSYKRVMVTFIKEANKKGVYASSVAVPLFERIAHKMIIHDHQT
jgi:cell division protein FtsI (penicillin-binding protein 3)